MLEEINQDRRRLTGRARMLEEINQDRRRLTGGVGHNLPQKAPQAFAQAVVDVDAYHLALRP
jgi:hypothetical protein